MLKQPYSLEFKNHRLWQHEPGMDPNAAVGITAGVTVDETVQIDTYLQTEVENWEASMWPILYECWKYEYFRSPNKFPNYTHHGTSLGQIKHLYSVLDDQLRLWKDLAEMLGCTPEEVVPPKADGTTYGSTHYWLEDTPWEEVVPYMKARMKEALTIYCQEQGFPPPFDEEHPAYKDEPEMILGTGGLPDAIREIREHIADIPNSDRYWPNGRPPLEIRPNS